jgi:arylsulfatase A-like enzyme
MKTLLYIWSQFRTLLGTLLLLLILIAAFILLRIATTSQEDNINKLNSKQLYLEKIRTNHAQNINDKRPNIVFILYDDMGYGDIGFGANNNQMIKTPHIDRLAANGVMLSDFHSPAPVCTPSRAGYLTGRLPARAGLPNVVFPSGSAKELAFSTLMNPEANKRLPAEEITLADILSAAGYATGMVGKWHLGDQSPSLPNDMGFQYFYGALYSNDMEPFALYQNKEITVEAPVDQRYLTELYTRQASNFIDTHAQENFFLYFAHNFPHDPLSTREERSGQSNAGLYGDVLEEIDDSVGEIVSTLKLNNILDNTLIIISSDNGPWFLGNAGNQRGRKGNTFEGGMRVPFIAHWPNTLTAGRSEHAMSMGTDLLPTVLDILNIDAPTDRDLDGKSILSVLTDGTASPHEYLYYYDGETLFAVRDQRFKYRGPAGVMYSTDEMPMGGAIPQKEWLFDLQGDAQESYDTANRYPQNLQRLRAAFNAKTVEMNTNKRGWK